jgi:hypothetical protein
VIAPIVALMLATLPGPAVSGMVREVNVRAERILVVRPSPGRRTTPAKRSTSATWP